MNPRELLDSILHKLKAKGADKVSLRYDAETDEEFNIIYKELNLLRTVETNSVALGVIKDAKQASTRLNQFDAASLDRAVEEVMQAVENSNPDPAFDISPLDEGSWTDGELEPDPDRVIRRLQEFISQVKNRFPSIQFDGGLTHQKNHSTYLNSNGAWFEHRNGAYKFNTIFTAKQGRKTSSMNYSFFAVPNLDRELLKINFTEELIRQTTEQVETKPVPANFTGDLIVSPYFANELAWTFIQSQIGSGGLLNKTSKFPDHLGQRILDEKLNILHQPEHPELCYPGRFSEDGFRLSPAPIIENGILRNYPISLYAANKTGKQRSVGPNLNLVIPAGPQSLQQLIATVKEGVLCMRASFGGANANGDFSGVLKNSYYLRDGKISHPISETMFSGNIIEMLNNVAGISSETFNLGDSILPYLQIRDLFISRK